MSNIKGRTDLNELIIRCQNRKATDLYLNVGTKPAIRIHGKIEYIENYDLTQEDVGIALKSILTESKASELHKRKTCTFPYSIPRTTRTRVIVFMQRGTYAISFRIGKFDCPSKEELRLPEEVDHIFDIESGLVIISGLNSSGRSSTASYIIDTIRKNKQYYINTLENPIEYLYKHDRSLVNQIEVGVDVPDILSGIDVAFRGYADVVYISHVNSREAMEQILYNVRSGKIIIIIMDVTGAANVVRNIINMFPEDMSSYIRTLLSQTLSCVISQQLIPDINDDLIPVCDIMYGVKAISSLIQENKLAQIEQLISNSSKTHMLSHDNHLLRLFQNNTISEEVVRNHATNWKDITQKAVH